MCYPSCISSPTRSSDISCPSNALIPKVLWSRAIHKNGHDEHNAFRVLFSCFYSLICRIHKSSLSQKYPSYITWEKRYNHTDSNHANTHPSNVNKFMLEISVAAQSFQINMKISVIKRRRSEKAHICSNGNKLRQSNIKTSSCFTETQFCGTTHCS